MQLPPILSLLAFSLCLWSAQWQFYIGFLASTCAFPPLEHMFNIWDRTGCLKLWSYQFVFLRRHRCPNMLSPRALNVLIAESAHLCLHNYYYLNGLMFWSSTFSPFAAIMLTEDNWIIYKEEINALIKRKMCPDDLRKLLQWAFHIHYFHLFV